MSSTAHGRNDTQDITCWAYLSSIAICIVLVLIFSVCFSNLSGTSAKGVLENKINVNVDAPGSIERLAGIGPSRANNVVAFREQERQSDGRVKIFRTADDLERVKGIGPKTVEKMKPYLRFD